MSGIQIPDGVREIGQFAFFECDSLKTLTLSEHISEIGYWAFREADGLVIEAPSGSYARSYAKENGIKVK